VPRLEPAYASRDDFERVLRDDEKLFDGFDLYIVDNEDVVVDGQPLDSPIGKETPESKVVWFFQNEQEIPAPPAGARRVVDDRVREKWIATAEGMSAIDSL
jgi:hypothetical protein